MKRVSLRTIATGLCCTVPLLFSLCVGAQVLETPQIYQLPPFDAATIDDDEGIPVTLDAGVIAGVNSQIGNVPLNDVAVGSLPTFTSAPQPPAPVAGGTSQVTGRFWSLVHTSSSNTRELAVATPVDIVMGEDCDQYYDYLTSLQILDLTGDGANDLAFMGPCNLDQGFSQEARVFGLEGAASDPFQASDSLTQLGSNLGGFLFPEDGGQLALVSADFNGDGLVDLGYYNQDTNDGANTLQTLLNDGTLGLLPTQISAIDGPAVPPIGDSVRGVVITTGDFDGNGTQDIAVAYSNFTDTDLNELQVYSGNGDGTFVQAAIAQANLVTGTEASVFPLGLTSGDFDGNGDFADFAVTWDGDENDSFLSVVLCSDSGCNVSSLPATLGSFAGVVVSADFNGDGQDDLANIESTVPIRRGANEQTSVVQVRLNNGGGFDAAPNQTLTLDPASFDQSNIPQLVAEDIDGCGGPDLAFTGYVYSLDITEGSADEFQFQTAVAFNPNEGPVANAGNPVDVTGGVQVGGAPGGQPTCSDPTDDVMVISWTVLSGEATISDSSASNPIVTGSGEVTVQVTCTDVCGLSDTATVTIPAAGFIQGSCGTSLTGTMSAGFNATWLAIPALMGILGMLRRLKA